MKRFVLAVTLACALSGTALAGHVPSTDVAAPQPPSPAVAIVLSIISAVF